LKVKVSDTLINKVCDKEDVCVPQRKKGSL
jgi:hypothetical protein